jgi:hypothetical protein
MGNILVPTETQSVKKLIKQLDKCDRKTVGVIAKFDVFSLGLHLHWLGSIGTNKYSMLQLFMPIVYTVLLKKFYLRASLKQCMLSAY